MIPLHTLTRAQMLGLCVPVAILAVLLCLALLHLTGGVAFVLGDDT